MDCRHTVERLSSYLDGELGAEEARQVRRHLGQCPRCAAELAGLQRVSGALDALDGMPTPSGFARRVRRAADRRRKCIRLPDPPAMRRRRVLIRAAAALVMAAGLWFGIAAGDSAFRHAHLESTEEEVATELSLDLFSLAPGGSLADVYLSFVDASEAGGVEDAQ